MVPYKGAKSLQPRVKVRTNSLFIPTDAQEKIEVVYTKENITNTLYRKRVLSIVVVVVVVDTITPAFKNPATMVHIHRTAILVTPRYNRVTIVQPIGVGIAQDHLNKPLGNTNFRFSENSNQNKNISCMEGHW